MSEQAQVGDTVRLTYTVKREGVVYENEYGQLSVSGWALNALHSTVEVLSRATPPLPSEPGTFWLDCDDEVWAVNKLGRLFYPCRPTAVADCYAPFRQLVLK